MNRRSGSGTRGAQSQKSLPPHRGENTHNRAGLSPPHCAGARAFGWLGWRVSASDATAAGRLWRHRPASPPVCATALHRSVVLCAAESTVTGRRAGAAASVSAARPGGRRSRARAPAAAQRQRRPPRRRACWLSYDLGRGAGAEGGRRQPVQPTARVQPAAGVPQRGTSPRRRRAPDASTTFDATTTQDTVPMIKEAQQPQPGAQTARPPSATVFSRPLPDQAR